MSNFDKYVAVVGCGYWGKNLVRNFAELGVLRVICDASHESLDKFKAQYGVEGVTDFRKVLDMPDVQAIVIATPAITHAGLVMQALAAGKDVFVEKPLALTLEDALSIEAATRKSGGIVMVGHLLEYHPALVKLRSLVAEGKIGKLQYVYSNRLSFGKVRTEENVLWSFAPHDICTILGFVGKLPISVQAVGKNSLGEVEDFCTINLEFEDKIKAHIFVSWFHPFKEHRLVVVGDAGTAVFDDVSVEEKLTIYEQAVGLQNNIPFLKENTKTIIPIEKAEPLKLECQHFLTCVQNRQNPITSVQNGIDVLTVLQAAQVSLESQVKSFSLKENLLVNN
ncbi:MAG: Gfo/Idh/MocA family oxidoreductase [Aetokthonos hydrillicola CCALA 1050]|nr:Gfo/Idh/MocA family oxidoreductase [Aetokthonos hydrillicola CCALA 1050]MBW4585683.1 Gfo/Idh/MocA family oxidoreductase [Aetokthonos hydrillicola CCALA 1050]